MIEMQRWLLVRVNGRLVGGKGGGGRDHGIVGEAGGGGGALGDGVGLAVGGRGGVVHVLRALGPLEHLLLLLLRRRRRVLPVHHLRRLPGHHDLALHLLRKLRLSSVHDHVAAHHLRLLLLLRVAQKMLTHASRSSWENSGTKVSGNPSAIWELSPEGLRESTWHRRLKRTTSLGPALGDDTVWEEHEGVTTLVNTRRCEAASTLGISEHTRLRTH